MRFYFQDRGQKVATKCIRVASDATVTDVIGMYGLHLLSIQSVSNEKKKNNNFSISSMQKH